ncbi:MAG: flagellar export protein FliJ [Deltaproteobacteria bacterium]|nr:flagellar export protein FliJ [Deltaproteobacteria bacterium]
MAFKFRLESVLDHRRHLEDVAQAQFLVELKVERECEAHIAWLDQEVRRARLQLTSREKDGISGREYAQAGDYILVLRLHARRERDRLMRLKLRTDRARKKLMEATRERKVLDILKSKHHQEYLRQERLAEQKFLDEVAVQGFVRRQSS